MSITIAEALAPVHPGEILLEEFLKPYDLSPYKAASKMHVPRTRIERLVDGTTPVTVDTARRLAQLFGTTPAFWMNLQTRFDLVSTTPAEEISRIEPISPTRAA